MRSYSYTGCGTCKKRKLKCDEVKPVCGQCSKKTRECVFHQRQTFRPFVSEGASRSDEIENHQTWVGIPRKLTFVRIHDPYSDEVSAGSPDEVGTEPSINTNGVNAVHIERQGSESPGEGVCDAFVDSPAVLTPETSVPRAQNGDDENALIALLLQQFKQGPGQWMDLFDAGAYFTRRVPVMASSTPLLKFAICALTTNYLQTSKHTESTEIRSMEGSVHPTLCPADGQMDWQYRCADYYDRSIVALKETVKEGSFERCGRKREELFAAVAILCAYELMVAPGTAWKAHLKALSLFGESPCRAAIKIPIFWSMARQDLICATISETRTQLDHSDIRLWNSNGVSTDEAGRLLPTSPKSTQPSPHGESEEDQKSHELTWLLGKITNYILGGDQSGSQEQWQKFDRDLRLWHDHLPATFTACARTRSKPTPTIPHESFGVGAFEEIWHEIPSCAATMQSYHMACILLLVNRPQEVTTSRTNISARLQSYTRLQDATRLHAREICGISLASPSDAVRSQSIQPLFVAGQVFSEAPDQIMVLELLKGIEKDMGWNTHPHVERLLNEWSQNPYGSPDC